MEEMEYITVSMYNDPVDSTHGMLLSIYESADIINNVSKDVEVESEVLTASHDITFKSQLNEVLGFAKRH